MNNKTSATPGGTGTGKTFSERQSAAEKPPIR
jgi:hypothetical protein